jgi:alpha-aminoadipic semialdehyde synthase
MKLGIRKEDKNIWESRVPLTPAHVTRLVQAGVPVAIQPSAQRAFADQAYLDAGAQLQDDLSDCPLILAVKEIPTRLLQAGKTYVYFAHVIKGQAHNMPMLARLLELGATLIDYERVIDEAGRRLIFFGRHAGLAGMIDSLWALGQRLRIEGYSTPLEHVQLAHEYPDLSAAKDAILKVGQAIAAEGLPLEIGPLVVGFAGYGNVSQGAQEIFDLLPHRVLEPGELPETLRASEPRRLTKVVFREEHMVRPLELGKAFDLQEYYRHPERFRGVFARHVPYLSVLVNCIFWTSKYPRLVTCDLLKGMFGAGLQPRLRVIGDISIDIEGAIECSRKATDPGDPVYVYLTEEDRIVSGLHGHGPVILAVDNLPCQLPVDASQDFGDALLPFIDALARADYGVAFDQLALPPTIRRAVIAHRGALTPDYAYLADSLSTEAKATQGDSK